MDEDREKGRMLGTATKRKASVDYAKSIMVPMREAVAANRKLDGSFSLAGVARTLNERGVPTMKGKRVTEDQPRSKFVAETVSRVLYKTEQSITKSADFECYTAIGILAYKAEQAGIALNKSEVAALEAKRDQTIAEGVALGRLLRCEDQMPPVSIDLKTAAKLILHQIDHRKRRGRWDESESFPTDGFEAWVSGLLKEALGVESAIAIPS